MIREFLLFLLTLLFLLPVVDAGYSVSYQDNVSVLQEIQENETYSFKINITNLSSDNLSLEIINPFENVVIDVTPIELEGNTSGIFSVIITPKGIGYFEGDVVITLETQNMKAGKIRIPFQIRVLEEEETNWLLILIGAIIGFILLIFGIKVRNRWLKKRS